MKVRYTETALAEIDEIFSYIASDNSTAANAVVRNIEHTIGLIELFPKIGRLKLSAGRTHAAGTAISSVSRVLYHRKGGSGDSQRPPRRAATAIDDET